MREVAGDEGLAHELAGGGDGGKMLEAISEAGEDLAEIVDERRGAEGQAGVSVLDPCLPEAVGLEVVERVLRGVLVVVFADEQETSGEAVAELLAPWYVLGSGEAFVDEVEGGEQEQRLVRALVRCAFIERGDADIEVVETFDGGIQKHSR